MQSLKDFAVSNARAQAAAVTRTKDMEDVLNVLESAERFFQEGLSWLRQAKLEVQRMSDREPTTSELVEAGEYVGAVEQVGREVGS